MERKVKAKNDPILKLLKQASDKLTTLADSKQRTPTRRPRSSCTVGKTKRTPTIRGTRPFSNPLLKKPTVNPNDMESSSLYKRRISRPTSANRIKGHRKLPFAFSPEATAALKAFKTTLTTSPTQTIQPAWTQQDSSLATLSTAKLAASYQHRRYLKSPMAYSNSNSAFSKIAATSKPTGRTYLEPLPKRDTKTQSLPLPKAKHASLKKLSRVSKGSFAAIQNDYDRNTCTSHSAPTGGQSCFFTSPARQKATLTFKEKTARGQRTTSPSKS